jgi:RNA 2',3'-cyclic 3'-phosphodiesterase
MLSATSPPTVEPCVHVAASGRIPLKCRDVTRVERLFVAVWPDAAAVAALTTLVDAEVPGVRWIPPANWHVTLRFLGNADAEEVDARLSALVLPAATATIGPKLGRLGHDVIAVPVGGLDELAGVVRAATADIGKPPGQRPFHGHLTLARRRRRAVGGSGEHLAGTNVTSRFVVRDITLVCSTTSPSGAKYEVVARYPVRAT